MRNHVAKLLVGVATANTSVAQVDISALTNRQIIAFDFDTQEDITANTKNIGFAKGTETLGHAIIAGPIPVSGITGVYLNPYKAAVNKAVTLTVTTVPAVGKSSIFKVVYHDNLSIIPNQIKQTVVSVLATPANTASTTTFAAAIAAEFNAQLPGGQLFVTVSPSTNTVVFTGKTITTASQYNGIDRPEVLNFEVSVPDTTEPNTGAFSVATTTALASGQGSPAQVAWAEDQHMGRLGYADRRMWNNTKQYQSQVVAGETYARLVITADKKIEGDMQGVHHAPIGAVIYGNGGTVANIVTDLANAGVVPETIPAG